jgi:hypothetical protein
VDFVGLVSCIRFYGDSMSPETRKYANVSLLAVGLIFLSSFNQIWILWADFLKSPQYQISQKSVQWEPCRYIRTDGHETTMRQ